MSERPTDIKRVVLSRTLQHPLTLYPTALGLLGAVGIGLFGPVTVAVAAAVAGLDAERFLILPHPEVADFMVRKATDRDGWIAAMQRLQARLGLSK